MRFEVNGRVGTLREHCEFYGVKTETAKKRIERGMSPAQAVTCPVWRTSFKGATPSIYMIKNTVNSKIYIGISTSPEQRWKTHQKEAKRGKSQNRALHIEMREYGPKAFSFCVIEKCKSIEEMVRREKELIAEYNSLYPNGYNMKPGGDYTQRGRRVAVGGMEFISTNHALKHFGVSKETYRRLKKLSLSDHEIFIDRQRVGRQYKTRITLGGVTFNSIKDACKAHNVSYATYSNRIKRGERPEEAVLGGRRKESSPRFRKSIEFRGKLYCSISHVARDHGLTYDIVESRMRSGGLSLEEAITKGPKGSGHGVGSKTCSPVRCVETGEVFHSISAAAKWVGIKDPKRISELLRGKGRTCKGYHWEYVP